MALKEIRQFSHLILEENEEYIADISCSCKGNIQKRMFGKSFKGRIRIGSKSIIIEPDDSTISMIKVLFPQIINLKIEKSKLRMILNSKIIRLVNVQVIDGKSRSITPNEILIYKETSQNENQEFEMEITISNEDGLKLMDLCSEFWNAYFKKTNIQNKIDDLVNKWTNILYNNEILNVEYEFLMDHRDQFLLSKPIIVNRIKPFIKHRGILHIVSSGICFKPLPNFSNKPYKRIPLKNVWFIFRRIYSMRANSMEIIYGKESKGQVLSTDSISWRSLFLEFHTNQDREHVVTFLQSYLMNLNNKKCQWNIKVPQYASCQCLKNTSSCLPMIFVDPLYAGQSLCFKKHIQNLWINGVISTYHYLDYLNNIAGRSKVDLTQYPVFPWTIVNFESSLKTKFDLNEISNYRNLSKPLGSLNQNNLEILRKRMKDLPYNEQFLYGSHYSTPGYISYFLVRLFPEYQLKLHCGDFDVWNRMFHSMNDTWKTILEGKTTYMELIPQFYEQNPDFLLNNKLCIKTNHGNLLNVQLPEWNPDFLKFSNNETINSEYNKAKIFLKTMRYCLESEIVSQYIHEWIDLIFGYKQRGLQAVDSDNLFHPITYINSFIAFLKDYSPVYAIHESTNELNKDGIIKRITEDDLALKAQVEEFGQVPIKLFNDPHPKRDCSLINDSIVIQHLKSECSNLPWFVLFKNNPHLIESRYDFNDHEPEYIDEALSVETYSTESKIESAIQFVNDKSNKKDENVCFEHKLNSKLKNVISNKKRSFKEKRELQNINNFNINFKESLILQLENNSDNIFEFQLFDEDIFKEKSGKLDKDRFKSTNINLIDLHEITEKLILITVLTNSEKLHFYLKLNEKVFKLIYSTYIDLFGNIANSINILVCDSKIIYLTIGTLSGDIFYYKFKLLSKTLSELASNEEIYILVLKDQIIKQYNMDAVELITSLQVDNYSYITVVSMRGILSISKHSNLDENFKKSIWFPILDIPTKDEKVIFIIDISVSINPNNLIQYENQKIIRDKTSRFGKITKDIDSSGFSFSCVLSNKDFSRRRLWYLGNNDLFFLDISTMLSGVFSIQNNYKKDSKHYGPKEIESSRLIGWITIKEDNLLFCICYNEKEKLSIIVIWHLVKRDTKIYKIAFIHDFKIESVTWDKYREGIVAIGETVDVQGIQEKGIYFLSQTFWLLSNNLIQTSTLKDSFVLLLNITRLISLIDQNSQNSNNRKVICTERHIFLSSPTVLVVFHLVNKDIS